MSDSEKVIMALELHRAGKCQDTNGQLCPYWECFDDCYKRMADDILSLLKEQKEIKEQFIEAFNTIRDAYNAPANREKILLNYLARNTCCCKQKEYEIIEDCMFDKEHETWVPTIYKCGRCHSKVEKTNTMCWHCRAKLIPIKAENT